jgi:hypothetical protein
MKFRKKPVVIEAVLWNGDNWHEIRDFMGVASFVNRKVEISTLEGVVTASIGDWIIKGVKGEFYPCKPDVFAQTYEQVEEQP